MVDRADALNHAAAALPAARPAWAIALVIAAQAAALAWLMVVPLPSIEAQRLDALAHAEATGEAASVPPQIRRGFFLLAADEHLARAAANLSDLGHLGQRLPIVLAALLIAGAAIGLGDLVLRGLGLAREFPPLARWPLAFASGATLLAALTLAAGRSVGLASTPTRVALGLLAAAGLAAWIRDRVRWKTTAGAGHPRPSIPLGSIPLALLLAPVLTLMALGAMQPTIEYDALEYHLQGPKEYYEAGRVGFLAHNVYTSMPSAVEMLHLLGMLVLDDWWAGALVGQLLIAGFAPATAALVAATAWRWGSGRAAWVAALVYLTTPWVFRLGTFPFVEGPLCSYHAALVYVAALAWTTPRDDPGRSAAPWLLAGLLAGGAMACKYPGLVSAVVPFGLLAVARSRRLVIPAAFAVGVIVAVGPWLARNAVDTGNPVYPLAYGVFGGGEWDDELALRWQRAHGPRPITAAALASSALDVIGRSDWHSPLYALLVPLAFLRRGGHRWLVLALGAYGLYLFATWFVLTHRLDRFWLPLLPAAAVLAGLGADWTRSRPWPAWLAVLLALVMATNLVFLTTPLSGPTDWTADLDRLRREAMASATPSLARLDDALPEGSRSLVIGQAGVFHVRHPILYNTVFNRERLAGIVAGRSPGQVAEELRRQGITHIYVDWAEVNRHRKPGGYGFSPVVTRDLFEDLVAARVLSAPVPIGPDHLLYRVVGPSTAPPLSEEDRSP